MAAAVLLMFRELPFMTAGAFTIEHTYFDYIETKKRLCKASSHLQEKYFIP